MLSSRPAWERLLPLAILLGAALVVPFLVWSDAGLPKLNRLRAEREALRDKASRIEQDIRQLQAEVDKIKTDPASVEQAARDQLGLVRQTEVVFQFQR